MKVLSSRELKNTSLGPLERNAAAMPEDVPAYVKLQKELLVLEREAEREETALASEGAKLSVLQSSGVSTNFLFGRPVATQNEKLTD